MATEFISNSWLMPTNANADANRVSNYSLDFNGIDEAITITRTASIEPTNITVACWVNVNATGSHTSGYFVSKIHTSGASASYGIYKPATPTFLINIGGVARYSPAYGTDIRGQGWQHLVGTYDGSHIRLYVNGTEVGSGTAQTGSIDYTTENAFIGSFQPSLLEIDGKITETVIYDYALTDGTGGTTNQIGELYGTGSAIGNPMAITNGRKPVAYYPLGNSGFNSEFLVPNGAEQDYVFDFSGTNYINCANDSSLQITGALTVSVWFKILNNSGNRALVTRDTGSTQRNWSLYITTTGTLKLLLRNNTDTGWNIVESSSAFDDGKWHQGAFVYTPSTSLILYVDGVAVDTNTTSITSSINNETADFTIGAYSPNQGYTGDRWIGQISNVATFNTALAATGAESVESLYNYGTPPNIASYSGLEGWWELDASATFDGSNWSIPDASSNSNTGTSSNMTAANLILSDLVINQPFDSFSLQMDGSDEYINCGTSSDLEITGDVSISAWVYITTGSAYQGIVSKRDSGGTNYQLYTDNSATPKLRFYDGSTATSSTGTVSLNAWHHIAITIDSGVTDGSIFYIDGVASGTATFTIISNDASLIIGAIDTGSFGSYFSGSISNCSIYNSALSATQVKTLYNEHKPFDLNTFAVTPVSWWRLGSVNTFYNSTTTEFTVLDEIGTNNGTSANMEQSDLVSGVGATGSGTSSGMSSGTNRIGNAPYSENNAVSYNLSVTAKSSSTPT